MKQLSDVELLRVYKLALELRLDREFVRILKKELSRRGIDQMEDRPERLQERRTMYTAG